MREAVDAEHVGYSPDLVEPLRDEAEACWAAPATTAST